MDSITNNKPIIKTKSHNGDEKFFGNLSAPPPNYAFDHHEKGPELTNK